MKVTTQKKKEKIPSNLPFEFSVGMGRFSVRRSVFGSDVSTLTKTAGKLLTDPCMKVFFSGWLDFKCLLK